MSAELEALTDKDWSALRAYATWRMGRHPGGLLRGRDADDLLQQAFLSFLGGGRRRVEGQGLVDHLRWIMHSVAGSWAMRKAQDGENDHFEENPDPDESIG